MASRSDDIVNGLNALGKSGIKIPIDKPCVQILEAFPNRHPERNYIVAFEFPEFTSLCPVTGQPDFGTIRVEYIPDLLCVESKSFKLYMFAFRGHQSFMETITNKILDDLNLLLSPRWIAVQGLFASRGGVKINVFTEKYKNQRQKFLQEVKKTVSGHRLGRGSL